MSREVQLERIEKRKNGEKVMDKWVRISEASSTVKNHNRVLGVSGRTDEGMWHTTGETKIGSPEMINQPA